MTIKSPALIPAFPAGPSATQRFALYVILAASVLVGGGIIYWKFVKPKFFASIDSPAATAGR